MKPHRLCAALMADTKPARLLGQFFSPNTFWAKNRCTLSSGRQAIELWLMGVTKLCNLPQHPQLASSRGLCQSPAVGSKQDWHNSAICLGL